MATVPSVTVPEQKSGEKTSKQRWIILKNAILQKQAAPCDSTNDASVRRFSAFGLLSSSESKPTRDGDKWLRYTCPEQGDFSIEIKHLSSKFSAGDLIGFNNTGNVCVWPAEEIMCYYCLKNRHLFRNRTVCELGGGMTCLAGLAVAACSEAAEVTLTDGNETSITNVQHILNENCRKFGATATSARVLKWNEREAFTDLAGRFDCIISADCLFFDQFRKDLVDCIGVILKAEGIVTIFAPRRGRTLNHFCQLAESSGFRVQIDDKYDGPVWQKHQNLLTESKLYDANIHYPLMVTLTRLR